MEAGDIETVLVGTMVSSAIDDASLKVVFVDGSRLTTLCWRSQNRREQCEDEAGEHWRKMLHFADRRYVCRRRSIGSRVTVGICDEGRDRFNAVLMQQATPRITASREWKQRRPPSSPLLGCHHCDPVNRGHSRHSRVAKAGTNAGNGIAGGAGETCE